MKLRDALFKSPYGTYQVELTDADDNDFLDWGLTPLMGPTLAAEYVPGSILQGHFVISARAVSVETSENCYLDLTMPERICEHHFVLREGRIVRGRGRRLERRSIIPALAIEKSGNYTLFLAKENPEAGADVLKSGLLRARNPVPVALDLAYVLRDSGKHRESIEMFTLALNGLPEDLTTYYYYLERARLYEKTGDTDKAREDTSRANAIRDKSTIRQ